MTDSGDGGEGGGDEHRLSAPASCTKRDFTAVANAKVLDNDGTGHSHQHVRVTGLWESVPHLLAYGLEVCTGWRPAGGFADLNGPGRAGPGPKL